LPREFFEFQIFRNQSELACFWTGRLIALA
jgi:hypothetical protein